MYASVSVGIDVAKAHLDAHLLPDNKRLRVTNDPAGHEKLLRFVLKARPDRVVLESTGGYERAILHCLVDAGVATARINPAEARAFARANRILFKNDPKDTWVLAEFGRMVETRPVSPCCKIREVLRELVTLRRQLVDQHTRLQNQLEHVTVPMVIDSIQRSIQLVKQELKAVQKHIQQQIDSDPALKQKQQKLRAAVGVGQIVSTVLVTELPELGTLHRNRIAALVGVAPYDDDSGQHRGKRAIYGGRSTVRSALYMATLVAIRRDEHTREYYQRLLQRGKPKKVAIVACMHKRLNYLNSLIREPANPLPNPPATPPAAERNEAGAWGQSPQIHRHSA